jgi:ABC-type nickel/cobalt efflux system permease component RcnA
MTAQLEILLITAASIGFFHTLLGPDHYLPFIVMSKARNWSMLKTVAITAACGVGHVGSSIVLGLLGVLFGIGLHQLEIFESARGNIAAWALTAFGLVYLVYGIRRAVKNRPHKHFHLHGAGEGHVHEHSHTENHAHVHDKNGAINITPWILFTIFVLGPCEPLIPILMYPAAESSVWGLVLVASVFSIITIGTMLTIVILASKGIQLLKFKKIDRFSHALAGGAIFASGLAIILLGA